MAQRACEERVTCHLYLSWAKRALQGKDVVENGRTVNGTEQVTRKCSFVLSHLENWKPLRRAARFKQK